MIVPVPDSGVPAAIGFAQESSIPYELGIIRNHYVGRTIHSTGLQSIGDQEGAHEALRPIAPSSAASALSSWTIPSSAARRRARSSR